MTHDIDASHPWLWQLHDGVTTEHICWVSEIRRRILAGDRSPDLVASILLARDRISADLAHPPEHVAPADWTAVVHSLSCMVHVAEAVMHDYETEAILRPLWRAHAHLVELDHLAAADRDEMERRISDASGPVLACHPLPRLGGDGVGLVIGDMRERGIVCSVSGSRLDDGSHAVVASAIAETHEAAVMRIRDDALSPTPLASPSCELDDADSVDPAPVADQLLEYSRELAELSTVVLSIRAFGPDRNIRDRASCIEVLMRRRERELTGA